MSAVKALEDAIARTPETVRLAVELEVALVRHQMRANDIFAAAVVLAVVREARAIEDEIVPRRTALLDSLDQTERKN